MSGAGGVDARALVPVVEVVRSGRVESVHLGAAVVTDGGGRVLASAGDPSVATYLRSAAKPVQLLAMLRSNLERSVTLTDRELAVCAASHGGEPGHVEVVEALLERGGLSPAQLRCGALAPLDPDARDDLLRRGEAPGALHNNCSGKHTAMLLTSRANGWPLEGYLGEEHPLQRRIAETVETLSGAPAAMGVDGCGVPTFYMELTAAARMTAGLMALAGEEGAASRIVAAMTGFPWYTSATRRLAFHLMRELPGVLAKEGAEGFFVVGLSASRSPWGVPAALAVKAADGGGEEARGRDAGVVSALLSLGVATGDERRRLEALRLRPSVNATGRIVGEIRGVLGL